MIGRTNTGGGGSIKGTDAILRVIAPAGSTVTISKGGVSKSDLGHENASDPTLYDYYFVIHQSQFDGVNPWTVTATLGGDTETDTIIINSADEYDVVITYAYFLIKHGVIKNELTGVVYGSNTFTFTESDGYVLSEATVNNAVGVISGTAAVDLTEYSTLSITIVGTSSRSWYKAGTCPVVCIGSTRPTPTSAEAVSNILAYTQIRVTSGTTEVHADTYTLDVSNYTGNYYICVTASGITGEKSRLDISEFKLIK